MRGLTFLANHCRYHPQLSLLSAVVATSIIATSVVATSVIAFSAIHVIRASGSSPSAWIIVISISAD